MDHGNKGRKQTPEHIAKRMAFYIGKPLSAEHKAKLAAIPRTAEWREKIRIARMQQIIDPKPRIKWWADLKADPIRYEAYCAKLRQRKIEVPVWNKGVPMRPESKAKLRAQFLGKPIHSQQFKDKMSAFHKGKQWRKGILHDEETKLKISLANKGKHGYTKNRHRGKDHFYYGKTTPMGTGKGKGSYCAAGHWVRSSWERGVADWLFKQNIAYEYEPQLFDFGNGLRYRPDFYLPEFDRWYEVKGWMTERAKQQIAAFRATGRSLFIIDRQWWRQYTNGRDDLPKEYMAA